MILTAQAHSLRPGPIGTGTWVSHKSERLIWGDLHQQAWLNKGTAKLTKCPTQALSRVLNNLDICEVSACWKACGDREGKCARTFWPARVPTKTWQSPCHAVPRQLCCASCHSAPCSSPLICSLANPGKRGGTQQRPFPGTHSVCSWEFGIGASRNEEWRA